jgi:hypothetical protein
MGEIGGEPREVKIYAIYSALFFVSVGAYAGERHYTVAEIASMRRSIGTLLCPGECTYYEPERVQEIEELLRTYILNGTDPQELRAAAHSAIPYDEGSPAR